MFGMLTNLTKSVVSVAASPVALVADIVTLPKSAFDGNDPFERTAKVLNNAGECFEKAVKPE